MAEQDTKHLRTEYTEKFIGELKRRMTAYENGLTKTVSATESKKRIREVINNRDSKKSLVFNREK